MKLVIASLEYLSLKVLYVGTKYAFFASDVNFMLPILLHLVPSSAQFPLWQLTWYSQRCVENPIFRLVLCLGLHALFNATLVALALGKVFIHVHSWVALGVIYSRFQATSFSSQFSVGAQCYQSYCRGMSSQSFQIYHKVCPKSYCWLLRIALSSNEFHFDDVHSLLTIAIIPQRVLFWLVSTTASTFGLQVCLWDQEPHHDKYWSLLEIDSSNHPYDFPLRLKSKTYLSCVNL